MNTDTTEISSKIEITNFCSALNKICSDKNIEGKIKFWCPQISTWTVFYGVNILIKLAMPIISLLLLIKTVQKLENIF